MGGAFARLKLGGFMDNCVVGTGAPRDGVASGVASSVRSRWCVTVGVRGAAISKGFRSAALGVSCPSDVHNLNM